MSLDDLPEEWAVWNDEPEGRSVLVYRPDVFDADDYPAECLPTVYVSRRDPRQRLHRRPGRPGPDPDADWHVVLYLEPEVRVRDCDRTCEARPDAVAAAVDVARAFADGEVDYRRAYQVARDDYLDALDDLTGREA